MAIGDEFGPGGGGQPFWGLSEAGKSSNQARKFATDPWDTFWMGTRQLPGECTLESGGIAEIEIDRKKGKGSDYTRVTLVGYKAREFRVTCQIATPEQWLELQDIVDVYWTIPGKTSRLSQAAVSVGHPGLAFLKIYVAVLKGITPPTEGKVDGTMTVTFTFQEVTRTASNNKNVTKTADSPAAPEDLRLKPATAKLAPANAPPPPPETLTTNLGTEGPE